MEEENHLGSARVNDAADSEKPWMVYILECKDGSLYTGITNDIERRQLQHNEGTASRYTRSRRPVVIRYKEACCSRSDALIRECALRLLSRKEKEALVAKNK